MTDMRLGHVLVVLAGAVFGCRSVDSNQGGREGVAAAQRSAAELSVAHASPAAGLKGTLRDGPSSVSFEVRRTTPTDGANQANGDPETQFVSVTIADRNGDIIASNSGGDRGGVVPPTSTEPQRPTDPADIRLAYELPARLRSAQLQNEMEPELRALDRTVHALSDGAASRPGASR